MSRVVIDVDARIIPRGVRTRSNRPLPHGYVIELTDSEDDATEAGPSHRPSGLAGPSQRSKGKKPADPSAEPSRARVEPQAFQPARAPPPLPLFLPDLLDEPHRLFGAPLAALPAGPEIATAVPAEPPRAPAPAEPELVPDDDIPMDAYVAQVLEIIPDVLPAHVLSLIEQHYPVQKDRVVEHVLHVLFENPDYPKADAKGKRRREDDQQVQRAVRSKIDYGDKNRRAEFGPWYIALAAEQLELEFVDIPTAHIRMTFREHNTLYAPTYWALYQQQRSGAPPYKKMARPRHKGKGKRVQKQDAELEKEMQWIRDKLEEEEAKRAEEAAEELRLQAEGGIECGCCFSEYPFEKMVQCPEAHLFCTSCMTSYAEAKLGAHDAAIVCMDQSGCKLLFPESELRRFLTPKLLELYERVNQRKEIEAAGLEGLEECPFCEYKVVIENEQERLFRCENEACGAVTCRQCKKLDHLPKSCQEVEEDKILDARHAIEEAMTRALMRNCPKCQKAFVKEMGCNKMTCPNCGTVSCYICRKVITGYDHFNNPPPYTGRFDPKKCQLWDASVEGRHSDEVTAAAKRALEEYKRTHPEVDDKDLAVDLPPPPASTGGPSRVGPRPHMHLHPLPQYHIPALPVFHPYRPVAGPVPAPAHAPAHVHAQNVGVHDAQWRNDIAAAMARMQDQQRMLEQQMGPVFNLQVHINQPAQAPPAPAPAAALAQPLPMEVQVPPQELAAPPPPLALDQLPLIGVRGRAQLAYAARRSARKRGGR